MAEILGRYWQNTGSFR